MSTGGPPASKSAKLDDGVSLGNSDGLLETQIGERVYEIGGFSIPFSNVLQYFDFAQKKDLNLEALFFRLIEFVSKGRGWVEYVLAVDEQELRDVIFSSRNCLHEVIDSLNEYLAVNNVLDFKNQQVIPPNLSLKDFSLDNIVSLLLICGRWIGQRYEGAKKRGVEDFEIFFRPSDQPVDTIVDTVNVTEAISTHLINDVTLDPTLIHSKHGVYPLPFYLLERWRFGELRLEEISNIKRLLRRTDEYLVSAKPEDATSSLALITQFSFVENRPIDLGEDVDVLISENPSCLFNILEEPGWRVLNKDKIISFAETLPGASTGESQDVILTLKDFEHSPAEAMTAIVDIAEGKITAWVSENVIHLKPFFIEGDCWEEKKGHFAQALPGQLRLLSQSRNASCTVMILDQHLVNALSEADPDQESFVEVARNGNNHAVFIHNQTFLERAAARGVTHNCPVSLSVEHKDKPTNQLRIGKILGTTREAILAQKESIVIGVSLGNQFFDLENLRAYIHWAIEHTRDRVAVLIPDKIHAINLANKSSRVSSDRAMRLAIREGEKIIDHFNRIRDALPQHLAELLDILVWDDVTKGSDKYSLNIKVIKAAFWYSKGKEEGLYHEAMLFVNNYIQGIGRKPEDFTLDRKENLCEYFLQELSVLIGGVDYKHGSQIRRAELLPYPYIDQMQKLIFAIQEGRVFPELRKKLVVRGQISFLGLDYDKVVA